VLGITSFVTIEVKAIASSSVNPLNVLGVRNRLQVGRVHAIPVVASMVQLQPLPQELTGMQPVSNLMRFPVSTLETEPAITVLVHRAVP